MTTADTGQDCAGAEDELRRSEAKYRSLIDLSPVAIFLLDDDGNFLSTNPAGEQLLQASSQEISGTNIAATYLPEELSRFRVPPKK